MAEPIDILIADDDEMTRLILGGLFEKLYAEQLETGQLRLKTAINGREAVDKALAEPPKLILMDIQMPLFDGIEAFYELKQTLGRRCPNIYFVSGYAKNGEITERISKALGEGALGFARKPVLEETLDRIVRAHAFEAPPSPSTT